jgi:hypothetical protein
VAEIDAFDIRSIMESLMVLHGKADRILELPEDDEEEEEEADG